MPTAKRGRSRSRSRSNSPRTRRRSRSRSPAAPEMYDMVRRYYQDVYSHQDEDQEMTPRELQEIRAQRKMVIKLQNNNWVLSDPAKVKFLSELREFYSGTLSLY